MTKKTTGIVRIGTSNIVVPGNRQSFPPGFRDKSRLHYYASLFNTVELNSTFYKVPMASTFNKWSLDVPENFRFTIKLWRDITHVKNLASDLGHIARFLNAADQLGNKKGCLLIQFPGKITLEYYNEVEKILSAIREQDPTSAWRIAVEFRSPGWYVSETHELLDEFGASIVLHDIPKARNMELNKKAKFVYCRYHGPKGDYRDSYTDEFLYDQAEKMMQWQKEGKDVYGYFNNTIGSAFENAIALNAMIEPYVRNS